MVGFDGERGDVVTIVSATFETPEPFQSDIAWYENNQVISGIKTLGAAIMFLFILLSIVRPVIKAYLPAVDESLAEDLPTSSKDGELNDEEMRLIEMRMGR